MSEWLDLMIEEVERKENEVAEAQAESARRAGDPGKEDARSESVQVAQKLGR